MSDVLADSVRHCPLWCADHFDQGDDHPDLGQIHVGLKSVRTLSIFGLKSLTTSLNRTDTVAGEPGSYAIELQDGNDTLLLLTPAEADYLAEQLHRLVAEARSEPGVHQEGSLD
ncbi:DUF6907 domain-containing protein [Nocardia sp. NBC_01327]|uniref:DUF6907 domain-containing protein n=1 Tax=Nocardia sp. NBC_01327 TaxID=2903593 RepID=UPI002E118D77|nr:hypothetical protein OG326_21620 [Nocardia sp. NBC_01327]